LLKVVHVRELRSLDLLFLFFKRFRNRSNISLIVVNLNATAVFARDLVIKVGSIVVRCLLRFDNQSFLCTCWQHFRTSFRLMLLSAPSVLVDLFIVFGIHLVELLVQE
jgi:hypothetical protein